MSNSFKITFIYTLFSFLILITNLKIYGQNISPKDVVGIKVKIDSPLNKNNTVSIDIILSIKDGWHINANKPLDDYLTPTVVSIKDTANIRIVDEEYPAPSFVKLKFSQTQLALYENEAIVKLKLKINKSFKKSKLKLKGEVQYQPCNDQTCLFPVSKPFSLDLNFKK